MTVESDSRETCNKYDDFYTEVALLVGPKIAEITQDYAEGGLVEAKTLRDEFAMAALDRLIPVLFGVESDDDDPMKRIASCGRVSYMIADAMMEARK